MHRISALSAITAFALTGLASGPSIAESASTRTEICEETNEQEISALFERWNRSLQTGSPHKVAANYAERSILLPTVSNKPRLTAAEKTEALAARSERAGG